MYLMRVNVHKDDTLLIDTCKDDNEQSELGYVAFCVFCALVFLYCILKSNSFVVGTLVFGLPMIFFAYLAFSNYFFSTRVVIDRHKNFVVDEVRGIFRRRQRPRRYGEFSAILIVQDKVHLTTLGMRARFRVFFRLKPETKPPRVLYVDEASSSQEAAKVAQKISQFTGWQIEFLTLDRTIEDADVDWESW